MSMRLATAWVGYQKLSDLKTSEWRSYGFLQKPIACKIGPSQNEDHAVGCCVTARHGDGAAMLGHGTLTARLRYSTVRQR